MGLRGMMGFSLFAVSISENKGKNGIISQYLQQKNYKEEENNA